MNIVAVAEIAIISIYFILPFVPAGIPFSDDFSWKFVNYAPVLTIGSLLILWIWWSASAKHWFTGPQHTIDQAVVEIAIISIYFVLPFVPQGNPFNEDFSPKFVNYAPVLTLGALALLTIWWHASAKRWFTGPKSTIDQAVVDVFDG